MRRMILLTVAALCVGGVFTVAQAQKTAPLVTRDSDRDGVRDQLDRCRNTAAGTRVDASGCPAPAAPAPQQTAAPSPQAPPPAAPAPVAATPPANTPAASPTTPAGGQNAAAPGAGRPTGLPAANPAPTVSQAVGPLTTPAVTPGAPGARPNTPAAQPNPAPVTPPAAPPATPPVTAPAAPPPAAVDPTMTAGYFMPVYSGRTDAAQLAYARRLALRLDSAIVALVENFRNTLGAPLAGAGSPDVISAREKRRWSQCRLIHYDLTSIAEGVATLKDSIAGGPVVAREVASLFEAFEDLVATAECDALGSMIEAPDRWMPWATKYATAATAFYRDWYTQLRAVHEADRAFARALLPTAPAGTFSVPAGLPRTAPTIGATR